MDSTRKSAMIRSGSGVTFALLWWATWGWAAEVPVGRPEEVGLSSDRLARLTQGFQQEIDARRLPGVVMMISRRGRLVYTQSLGQMSVGEPMRVDAIFRQYSMTKPWTSVAAMQLMEEARLQLTDPVSKYLPALKAMQVSTAEGEASPGKPNYVLKPAVREMTVQDLLRHTAGLVYGELTANGPVRDGYADAGFFARDGGSYDMRGMTPAQQIERLGGVPLARQPGSTFEYGIATDILGRVVEAVSGLRLGDFLAERLFRPLDMKDSAFMVPARDLAWVAQPFDQGPATGTPNRLIDVSIEPGNDSGGAGGVSTAMDYLRFGLMLLNGGTLDGARVLSRTSVELMTADHLGTGMQVPVTPGELLFGVQGYSFGLGFAVRQHTGIGQVAGSPGEFMWAGFGGTFFFVDPREQLVAIYMSQAPGKSRQYYRRMFKQLVMQAIVD